MLPDEIIDAQKHRDRRFVRGWIFGIPQPLPLESEEKDDTRRSARGRRTKVREKGPLHGNSLTATNVEAAEAKERNFSGLLDRVLARWLGKS